MISPSKSEKEDLKQFRSFHAYASFAGEVLAPEEIRDDKPRSNRSSEFRTHSSDFEDEAEESLVSLSEDELEGSSMGEEIGTNIDASKIEVLNKFKSKKLKKRLSEKNSKSGNKKNGDEIVSAHPNEEQDL